MQCPHCGAEVLAGNTFCQRCRKRVVGAGTATAPRPALRQEPVARPAASARASFARAGGTGGSFQRPGWVTLLAVLSFAGALLCLIGAGAVAVPMLASSFPRSPVMWIFAALYLGVGLLYLFSAIGLWRLKSWARYLEIAFAIISLIGIPVGTIIGVLVLVYMFKPGTKILFSGRSPGELSAEEQEQVRRASGGTVLLVIVTVLLVVVGLLIVLAIAIPSYFRARIAANEQAVIRDLRSIVSAETGYAQEYNGGLFDHPNCLMVPAKCLPGYGGGPPFLDPTAFSNETRHGYRYRFFAGPKPEPGSVDPAKTSSTGVKSFAVVAQPVQPGRTGTRTFCVDASGVGCTLARVDERELSQGACPANCSAGS